MEGKTLSLDEDRDIIWVLYEEILRKKGLDITKYIESGKVPMGTKSKPWWNYIGKIPEEDIAFFKFSKVVEPQSILFLGIAGTGKTMAVKRLLDAHIQVGYKTCVFEPKTAEWIRAKYKPKNIGLVEKPHKIDIFPIVPSFIIKNLPDFLIKDYLPVSFDIMDFTEKRHFWGTLDLPKMGIEHLKRSIEKYGNLNKIINSLYDEKLGSTKISLLTRLLSIQDDLLFADEYTKHSIQDDGELIQSKIKFKKLTKNLLKKIWNKNKTILFTFFSPEERYLSAYFYHVMRTFYEMTVETTTQTGRSKYHKKFIVVDDCDLIVGNEMKEDDYASVKVGKHALTLWRALGFMMVFISQHPSLINKHIIANSKHLFIYKIGSTKELEPYIANPKIIQAIKNLKYNPDRYIAQCCHVFPDHMNYEVYYPFLSSIGHLKNVEDDEE